MAIKREILDELLKDSDPTTIFSSDGLLGELKKAFAARVMNAEMDHHLAGSTQDVEFPGFSGHDSSAFQPLEGRERPAGHHKCHDWQ